MRAVAARHRERGGFVTDGTCQDGHDDKQIREPAMTTPSPQGQPPGADRQRQPMTLEESVHALARLNDQMTQLNAKLEYLRLMLKLGVK
jgi:hypothetical protein